MRPDTRLVAALACLLPASTGAQEQRQTVDIREWPVPWENSRPRDPDVGPDGRVWFVGQTGNFIAYFDPETEQFRRYEIEEGTNPHNLIVDERGVWYAGNRNARIGRLDPATGDLKIYPMPDPAARDPHTLVFAPDGNLWFTVQGGNFVGHLDAASGEVRLLPSPIERSRPYGIKMDADGNPWVVLFGTNRIVTVDRETMALRQIELPRADARPRRLLITTDQRIWYVDHDQGRLGRYDPRSSEFKEWPSPGGQGSRPYAMALDDRDRIWYVETGIRPNKFVGFDPATESFFSVTDIPSGGGAVRHMVFDPRTRMVWFGTDTGNIGRAIIP